MRRIILIISVLMSGITYGQSLYDNSTITTIELYFSITNWDQVLDNYYSAGLDQRLLADSVVINGNMKDSVGVKYKGNSTYNPSNAKNPLNIALDYIQGNQDYQGYRTLKFSNGKNDPSFIREVLSYEIARQYMVAPESNFSEVYINGVYHGLYTNTESINTDFHEKLYADEDETRIKCNPDNVFSSSGSSLEYLGPDSASYEDYYELKSDYGWNDLIDFTFYLENSSAFDPSQKLDIDKALWMLAFNNVLVNLDSYTGPFRQNYYLIQDDNNRLNTVLWDLNECLGGFEMINSGGGPPSGVQDLVELDPLLRQNDAGWPLIEYLLGDDTYRRMYIAHMRTILNENFVNGSYLSKANDFQSLIIPSYQSDVNSFYSNADFTSNLNTTVGSGPSATIGIEELMNDRVNFLQSHSSFTDLPPTIGGVTTIPTQVTPYTTPYIIASVSNASYVKLAYRFRPKDQFISLEMFDDGQHNDGAAGDGVYGIDIPVDARDMQYYIYAENNDAGIFSPERAEHEYHSLPIVSDLVINEMMAANLSSIADQNGEYDDWVELYNAGTASVNLSGYYLSDNENILDKWAFPNNTIIQPNGYLIVWLDGDEGIQSGLHTNFKLSADGEELFLSTPILEIVDAIFYTSIPVDMAFARVPNGNGPFVVQTHTNNANNTIGTSAQEVKLESKIYPNPARDYFLIENIAESRVKIYNSLGMLYLETNNNDKRQVNCENWPTGIYFIKIGEEVHRMIKQ